MFKTDVLLILIVKIVMMPEELKYVSNVSPQQTESLPFHNTHVFVKKVSMTKKESVNHVPQVVLSVQTPHHVKDVLFQPPTIIMELVHAHKAISSLLNH